MATTNQPTDKLYENYADRIINQHDYGLSFDQQRTLEDKFLNDEMTLAELAAFIYGLQPPIDKRSREFKTVKNYIAKLRRKVPTIEFTEGQIDFIKNNASRMSPKEVALSLFPKIGEMDPKKIALSKEVQTVNKLGVALGLQFQNDTDDKTDSEYTPPKADSVLIKKINSVDITADYPNSNLNSEQKKCVDALRGYLHTHRFLSTINVYKSQNLRNLFEQTFVQSTYNKPDLNADELNMYVSLCQEYVLSSRLQSQMETIQTRIDEYFDPDNEDARKTHAAFINAFSTKVKEHDECQKRMKSLQTTLSGSREKRLAQKVEENQSLTKFVELWKEEESRKRMLIIAEAAKLDVKKEIEKLQDVDEFVAQVMGISADEILHT